MKKGQNRPFPLTSRWFLQSFNSISFCIHVDQRDLRTRGDFASYRPVEVRWRRAGNQFAIRSYHDFQATDIDSCFCLVVATWRYNSFQNIREKLFLGKKTLCTAWGWDVLWKVSSSMECWNWLPWCILPVEICLEFFSGESRRVKSEALPVKPGAEMFFTSFWVFKSRLGMKMVPIALKKRNLEDGIEFEQYIYIV